MLKVVTFMKQVACGLQMEGNFGTAHVYRSSLNAIIAYRGKGDFFFNEVNPEWLKGFEDAPEDCDNLQNTFFISSSHRARL